MRRCIKCNRELPDGRFDDNWRHRVNTCRECMNAYQRDKNRLVKERKERNARRSNNYFSSVDTDNNKVDSRSNQGNLG